MERGAGTLWAHLRPSKVARNRSHLAEPPAVGPAGGEARLAAVLVENDLYAVQVVGQRGDVFADFLAIGAFGGFLDEFAEAADLVKTVTAARPFQVMPDKPDLGIILRP